MSQSDPLLKVARLFVTELPLALYLIMGAIGALWVSDDFDHQRLVLMAYLGLPGAIFRYAALALRPGWQQRHPRTALSYIAGLVLIFSAGVVPFINAATAPRQMVKRTIELDSRLVTRDERRGGLGWLFRTRW